MARIIAIDHVTFDGVLRGRVRRMKIAAFYQAAGS